jgi:hypothetical protein
MKSTKVLGFALAAALALPLAGTASAKTTLDSYTFNGVSAHVDFANDNPDGCINAIVVINLLDGEGVDSQRGPWVGRIATVYSGGYNRCTQTFFSYSGWASLSPDQFILDRGTLGSATLKVAAPCKSFFGDETVNCDIDLSWVATTSPEVFRGIWRYVAPDGTTLFNRDFSTTREASVSGTVSIGSMTFISDPSWFAEISDVKDGFHELSR